MKPEIDRRDPASGRSFDVYGIGSSVVVKVVPTSESEIVRLGLESTMAPATLGRLEDVFEHLKCKRQAVVQPGGSAENTIAGIAQLGGRAAYAGGLGDDPYGVACRDSLLRHGVLLTARPKPGMTGVCLVMVTPDGERTMLTHLGVSGALERRDVAVEALSRAQWLYVEGFLLAAESGREVVSYAVEAARREGARVAVSFSAPFIVETCGPLLQSIVREYSDLLFANELEAASYTGIEDPRRALEELAGECAAACVTVGVRGSWVAFGGRIDQVSAFPIVPTDLTGAGDLYAAGILYGLARGWSGLKAAELASRAARRVVQQLGPRLPGDLRNEVLAVLGAAH